MLKDLNKYKNLGTLNFFIELSSLFKDKQELRKGFINKFFSNRIIDGKFIFDGWYPLLTNIGLIKVDYDGYITASEKFSSSFDSGLKISKIILSSFLEKYSNDEVFLNIFSQNNFNFDALNRTLRIKRYAFATKNINLLDFLVSLEFLIEDKEYVDFLIINDLHTKEFLELSGQYIGSKKSIEELLKIQEKQRQLGELAEKFIIKYEQNRISSVERVFWIAPVDTGRGFDIMSYENSDYLDERFIEVKSYSDERKLSFYWSENEIKVAKENPEKYYLYLVDRSKIYLTNYKPETIQNPYKFFFLEENNWNKGCSNWFFKKN